MPHTLPPAISVEMTTGKQKAPLEEGVRAGPGSVSTFMSKTVGGLGH